MIPVIAVQVRSLSNAMGSFHNMAVNLIEPDSMHAVKGVRLAAITAGIKKNQSDDLVLIEMAKGSQCAAVFTQNKFCAAPVHVAKKNLLAKLPRYLLINSGNANAGTGEQGMVDALHCCQSVAEHMGCSEEEVLPFSTGVIGENLPVDKIDTALGALTEGLSEDNWISAGRGIMTTDTKLKAVSRQVEIAGKTITVSGISKGAGMIQPNMATMLGFIATDVAISKDLLQHCLKAAVGVSFNSITVDSDTSTNDACILMATAGAGNQPLIEKNSDYEAFSQLVTEVCQILAQAIIRDAEGATKFVSIVVNNSNTLAEARQVAYTVAHSPLVKTALFASDPNWGRILAAVGRAGVDFELNKIKIYLNDTCIVSNGGRHASYTEEQGQAVMNQQEITIGIELNTGDAGCTIWTSDLSYDYVKINSEYRS